MRYRDSRNIRTLARYLDRDWLAPSALRAFKALVAAGQQHDRIHIQEAVGPWDGEPVHVPTLPVPDYQTHVELVDIPALLDPSGQLVR